MTRSADDLTPEIEAFELELSINLWRRALEDYEPERKRRRLARWKEQHGQD